MSDLKFSDLKIEDFKDLNVKYSDDTEIQMGIWPTFAQAREMRAECLMHANDRQCTTDEIVARAAAFYSFIINGAKK